MRESIDVHRKSSAGSARRSATHGNIYKPMAGARHEHGRNVAGTCREHAIASGHKNLMVGMCASVNKYVYVT